MKAAAIALFAALALRPAMADPLSCDPNKAILLGGPAPVEILVEIADDPEERARGLMFRKHLPPGQGMLFIYEHPQPVSFWMRNTLIPLDIIFLDATGEIRHIHPGARPLDETSIPGAVVGDPAPERLMVLEVPGGDAKRLGLRSGMALAHPAVPAVTARAHCGD
ncbi:DUF192 domain-containing protein [Paracoccus ravus]|uniref:DUF192 domain-containing protein n=1 Tax=Paracoccus ravus TaxID=2447760 RepID=UPI00106E3678|nr:DUF192 domain-containing protein [Paracoccus ravus]